MKKNMLFSLFILSMLTACSADKSLESEADNEKAATEEIEVTNLEAATTNVADEDIEKESLANESIKQDEISENGSNLTISTDNTTTEEVSKETVIQIEDYYEYYKETSSKDTVNTTVEEKTDIVAERVNDRIIELPTVENNEKVIRNQIEEVPVASLESKGIMEYMEEPVSKGILISINLALLQEEFPAKSYSLVHDDIEYGIMVSNNNSHKGIVLIRDLEVLQTDIQQNAVINLIN